MENYMYTINLERGFPTVDTALKHLGFAISTSKANRYPYAKLIHGYGSSGVGGKIKSAVERTLITKKRNGIITNFIKGENFSIFDETTQKIILKYPQLTHDSDYMMCNHGITMVIFIQ